jgi:hypothetical protein
MNKTKTKLFTQWEKIVFSILLCAGFLNIIIYADTDGSITRSYLVNNRGKLTVDVKTASINITGKEGNEVKIKVSWKTILPNFNNDMAKNYKLEFGQSGSDVSVRLLDKDKISTFLSRVSNGIVKIHFDITVPEIYDIDVCTSGGRIFIGSLEGNVKTMTSGGSIGYESIKGSIIGSTSGGKIYLESCTEDVNLKTSGGSITIGSVNGNIYAQTSGGSIVVEKCGAEVYAHTSGGSIKLRKVVGTVDISTSGGSILVNFAEQPQKDCKIKTSGGSITVALPKEAKADFNAQTSGGRVKTDFQVTVQGELKKNKLIGSINGGGPLLSLKTSGGSINILDHEPL